jgi:hypothetical protein
MKRFALLVVSLLVAVAMAAPAAAQKKKKKKKKAASEPVAAETVDGAEAVAEPAAPPVVRENTLGLCRDGIDNDLDGHLDCQDQDCEIFAMCLEPVPPPPAAPPPPPPPARPHVGAGQTILVGPEKGRFCRDGVDNNNDGLIDCYEKSCQQSWRCRKEVYFVPEPEDKPPGLFLSVGLGLALPNFRESSIEAESRYGTIPFSPDVGGIFDLQIGYLPLPWIGFGANFKVVGAVASNRPDSWDYDSTSRYKYEAGKGTAHGGMFARFQYVFDRFVPYVNIGGGFTYSKYIWQVYNGLESWEDINRRDESYLYYPRDREAWSTKHWTFYVEPGFDFYLRKRSVAIGMRAFLPFAATGDVETDNTGLMITVSFTPTWREKPQVKPEYANPLGVEEGEEEPIPFGEPAPEVPAVEPESPVEEPPAEIEDPYAESGPTLTVSEAEPIEKPAEEPAPAE